jgi:hypothetical protein
MGGHGHDAKHDAKHDAPAAPEGEVAGLRTSYVGVSSPFLMDVKKGLFYGGVFSAGTSLSESACGGVAAARSPPCAPAANAR